MPQAIAPAAPTPAYGGSKPSSAGLQAQLQRYQQQLSDCVNCASAKTPQGKSDIAAIAARISQLRQNMAEAERSPPAAASVASQAAAPVTSVNALQGSIIDVFA